MGSKLKKDRYWIRKLGGMRKILYLLVIICCVTLCGCRNKEKLYSDYKDMIDNNKGYNVLRDRTKIGNYIYAVASKQHKKSYCDEIIKYNLNKKEIEVYDANTIINSICADKNYVYYINTKHNGGNDSYISKINKDIFKDKNRNNVDCIVSDEYKNIVLTHIEVSGNDLYAFGFDYNDKGVYSKMYIINKKDLTCKKVSDFSDYIIDVTDVCKINEKLYVAGRSARKLENNNYKEIDNKYIYEIDMAKDKYNSGEIRKIYIGDISHEIIYKRGYVYVSNYDEVLDKGNIIYVLNENGEIVDKMHMKEKVRSMNDIN